MVRFLCKPLGICYVSPMDFVKPDSSLPDVAKENTQSELSSQLHLKWVGMSDIQTRILWENNEGNYFLPAKLQTHVSLDKGNHRGIHMSRLFLSAQEKLTQQSFSSRLLTDILSESLLTHAEMSQSARLQIDFEIPKLQKSLKSEISSMRNYPVSFEIKNILGQWQESVEITVLYSSTCPASAALSQQLIQQQFLADFKGKENIESESILKWLGSKQGMIATPHAQRSWAKLKFARKSKTGGDLFAKICETLIDEIEAIIETPVQSAVKRIDEQEFARLNGKNMMFCEDAARKIKAAFINHPQWTLLAGEVHHVESLHPHEAVAYL